MVEIESTAKQMNSPSYRQVLELILAPEDPRGEDVPEGLGAIEVLPERLQFKGPSKDYLTVKLFKGVAEEPHILLFPGELDGPESLNYLATGFGQFGFTFMAMEYAGGTGSLSELLEQARALIDAVSMWKDAQGRTGPLVPMGRSLGCGIALDAAGHLQDKVLALILESAFDRSEDFFRAMGLDNLAMDVQEGADPFSNREKMKSFKPPVLFLHSHIDDMVTIKQVEWLVAESRSKASQFQIIPSDSRKGILRTGGSLYFSNIRDYLYLRMGKRPKYIPRRKRKGRNTKGIF